MLEQAKALQERIRSVRRAIHEHPELGYEELRTAALVAETLESLGISVQSGVARTGVVGTLDAPPSGEGRTVALRADMDALPIQEENEVSYKSQVPGLMHACGHDMHVAALLGAAMLLAENPPAGRVKFLFQPSEEGVDAEGKSGGRRFVEEGVMDDVDAVFGLHVSSEFPVGMIGLRPGPFMAAADLFDLEIMGQGCHGAYPHKGIDTVLLSAYVILAMQQIVSRRIDPMESGVVTVGAVDAGTKHNIIPERALLKGTIRSFKPEVRQLILDELPRACSVARAMGGDFKLTVVEGYPPTVNDPDMTELVRSVAREILGPDHVLAAQARMGAEDFSFLAQAAPGCFFRLGVHTPGDVERRGHSSTFDCDESALPVGSAMLAAVATRFLNGAEDR